MPFKPGQSGNPKGRKPKSERHDSWSSILTGLGTSRDKRTSVTFGACVVTDIEARELWRGDDLSARAVETYPDEMLRAGYDVCIQADEESADDAREQAEAVEESARALGADEACRTALCYERAYGGAALFPVINDSAGDLSKPLNEASIPEVRAIVVFEPRELQPVTYYNDPLDPKYGHPEVYSLQPLGVSGAVTAGGWRQVHESRLILFPGKRVTRAVVPSVLAGWGDSVLTLVRDTIRDFNAGFGSVNHLLQDFSQAVISLQGLHDAVAADEAGLIKGRVAAMDLGRSMIRAMLLDAGGNGVSPETFQRVSTPLTGVSDVLDRMIYRLASALEMPATMLMGMSPAGLNPTGNGEIRQFYDKVSQKQDRHLRPRLERLLRLIMLSKGGPTGGVVPPKWSIDFCPLWQPSQKEVVDARLVQAQSDKIYAVDIGCLPVDDLVKSRFGGDGYSYETKVDLSALARMQAQEEAAKKAADAALAARQAVPQATTPVEE